MPTYREEILQDFFENIVPFQRCMRMDRDHFFKEEGISQNHIELLYLLRHQGQCSVKDVAENLGITSSAATQLIEAAEKLGHTERVSSPEDRRVVLISATKKGKEFTTHFAKRHLGHLHKKFEGITDQELHTLISIHTKIIHTIRERLHS